jgi:hypothetical protein
MGGCNCNCLLKDPESHNEMVNGIIPGLGVVTQKKDEHEIININTENDFEEGRLITGNNVEPNKEEIKEEDKPQDDIKLFNNKTILSQNNKIENPQDDSSVFSMIQEFSETIFDYFNEIRTSPDDFKQVADEHGAIDIIQKAIDSPYQCNKLIINSFFNLLLSSYINNNTDDGNNNEKIIELMEKEEKIKQYDKKIFEVEAEISHPNDAVWNLFLNNKDIAYETFFTNNLEYLIISCQKNVGDNNKFKCYFLLLSKRI